MNLSQATVCAACALLWVAPRTASAAGGRLELAYAPGGARAALTDGGVVLADADHRPAVLVYYADTPDIWKAQAWIELAPDVVNVTTAPGKVVLDMPSFGGRPVSVRAVGTIDQAMHEVVWRVSVRNRDRGIVVGVRGPALRCIRDVPRGFLAYPDRPGHRLDAPWTALANHLVTLTYPVPASMQYLAYAGMERGVAFHVHDRGMLFKHFVFGGPEREVNVLQFPFIRPGAAWTSPAAVWQALRSDWHAAADRYRAWFRTWASPPRISRRVQAMPVVGVTVIRARPVDDPHLRDVLKRQEVGTYAAALDTTRSLKAAGYQGVQLVGWFGQGHDTTYPDHRPADAMGGEAGLKDFVRAAHGMGMLVTLYLNARLANLQSPTLKAHPDWQVLLGNGAVYREGYGDQLFTLLCPMEAGWRSHLRDEVLRVARDYGADGAQLDQIGAATTVLCFDRSHGHRTPASAWGEGHPAMLRAVRDGARAIDPGFFTWVEGAWEGAGQFTDMYQGGHWPLAPGAVAFNEMYRYTLPEHPAFGDGRMGGVPYWCTTDLRRARAIADGAAPVFLNGRFLDTMGLSVEPAAEARWFVEGTQAVVSVYNPDAAARTFTLRLSPAAAGRRGAPRTATALAAGAVVPVEVSGDAIVARVEVPGRQVECVLLRW